MNGGGGHNERVGARRSPHPPDPWIFSLAFLVPLIPDLSFFLINRARPPPRRPRTLVWAHFPAFFTGRCGHMTKFWLMGQAKMLYVTSGLGSGKRASCPSSVFSLHYWNTNVTDGPGAAIINHKVSELKPHTADHCPPVSHCSGVISSWGPSEHPFHNFTPPRSLLVCFLIRALISAATLECMLQGFLPSCVSHRAWDSQALINIC